ncbi:MAG: hypothetical protein JXO72_01265 [Vicinamibacteria bacterium]|nr:hypothetical protein [Vicinamibacteria bacterium]
MNRRRTLIAIVLGSTVLISYLLSSGTRMKRFSGQGHYVTLAQWMIDGRLSSHQRGDLDDLVEHNGRWYIAFPPLPALLLVPWVLFSSRANPLVFTAVFAALNVVLLRSLLMRGVDRLGVRSDSVGWLTFAFAFGTAHWYASAAGTVWYTSQICGLTFLLASIVEALGPGRPWLCGLLLGLAVAARPPLGFAFPFFLMLLLRRERAWRALALFGGPIAGCVGLLLAYNLTRFGSPFDFGYERMRVGDVLRPFLEQGLFSLAHMPRNVFYALLNPPAPSTTFPFIRFDPFGNSFLLLSPFLLSAALARPRDAAWWGCWAGVFAIFINDLCYFSSGYFQAGYRYSLDFMPFLMLLAGMGFRGKMARLLVVVSAPLQLACLIWFLNWPRMWCQIFR